MSSYRLPDGSVPVLLSADNPEALGREAAAVADYLAGHRAVTPDQVADMLFRTRVARRYRALVMATDRDSLLGGLRAVAAGEPHPDVVVSARAATRGRVAYVFPGQGSQRPGMGRMLYDHSEAFRTAVDECDKIFHELYRWSPLSYLLDAEAPADDSAQNVQPALFMQMVGVAAMWQAVGVRPRATVGHSQGEITAAYVSGAQTLRDAVRIVTTRARIVDGLQLSGYSMAVLGIDRDQCEDLLARHAGFAELSVVNSEHILAISGERDVVRAIIELLDGAGKFAKEIRVQYPAHTSYVSGFREILNRTVGDGMDNYSFLPGDIDFIGATFGDRVEIEQSVLDYWYLNLRNRVRFDRAIGVAADRGADTFIEISEHPTLMLAIQENLAATGSKRAFQALGTSRRSAEDLREFTRNLATVAVHDADYAWESLRDSACEGVPALPLLDFPHTRMSPKTLWAPYPYATADAPRAAGARNADGTVVPQRYVERWTKLRRRKVVPPRAIAVVDHTGQCGDLVTAIDAAAPRQGATVVADAGSGSADTLVVLVPPSSDSTAAAAVDDLAAFLGERSWQADHTGVSDIWLVTTGGEQVLADEVPDPFHAAAQAGFRCLAAEYLGVPVRHVDLPAGADPAASAKALVGALHIAGEPELAVRDGGVHAKRLVVDDTANDRPLDAADLREVVIIGGTGKLGLDFCARFAAAGAGRITLVSRSGGDAAAIARLRDIERIGETEIVRRGCDIGDEEAVAALGAEFRDTPVSLIVHAAVDYAAAEAAVTPESIRAAAQAKSIALERLVRHIPRTDNGRIVLCSSLSATLGGRGHMVYSAVNRLLDVAAARYRADGVRCSSVQWGLWRAVGADNADALAKISGTGLLPMDPARAVTAGFAPDAANVLVAAADWGRISDLYAVFGYQPLFAELPEPEQDDAAAPVAETSNAPVAVLDSAAETAAAAVAEPGADTAETVRSALRTVMGLGTAESIDGTIPLVALGLDSLQALDLRKRIESELRRDLPVTAILGGASLDEVVSLLV
ncbi:nocobactin polyketide synthase NbtC [Nocardia spumae]|uniref:nocobactin polyketide synthase NbtC n=1 Tax=Nocardia spumae TaxID=2887190 RepID=UPI001D13A53A|nr:nocobactin polyketide synthase NbtC [Nocardia spumae]